MANMSPVALILIVVVCAVVALLVGYFLGSRFGGKKSVAMKEATEQHDSYKNDVREHFEQTSAIMSRMVDDYRDMYQHMAEGAEKLAEMHPEKLVTPPPAPEAITRDTAAQPSADADAGTGTGKSEAAPQVGDKPAGAPSAAKAQAPSDTRAPNRDAVMNSDSSNDRPWNNESRAKGGKRYGLE
jgi:uncharacterized membrane-anchored protein YhcB (DUF1043 family)